MKHVGKQISTNDKIILLFREVPGEPDNCLVARTASLSQDDHDSLVTVLESDEGQQATTLAEVLHTRMNGAGRPILESLHTSGRIMKLPASDVALTPDTNTSVALSEINAAIRGQEATASEDMGGVLTDDNIASDLRRQAAGLQAEAKRLLAEAEELSPTKKAKKTTKKKTSKKKATKASATA